MSEKEKPSNSENIAELQELYDEIYEAGCFVKEFRWSEDKYGAAVGTIDELVKELELEGPDDVTEEVIASLPPFIMFAMPGSGVSRQEAIRQAYAALQDMQQKELEKQREREAEEITARKALFSGDEGEVHVVWPDKIIKARWEPTDQFEIETYRVGGKTMSFNRRVHEFHETGVFREVEPHESTSESREAVASSGATADDYYNFANVDFQTWLRENKAQFLTKDAVYAWAEQTAHTEVDYENDVIPCGNCKGRGVFTNLDCLCREANSITDLESGTTLSDKDDKTPDPDCEKCGGTGHYDNPCPVCDGAREQYTYPLLTIYDPATEATRSIRYDLAAMIREYPEGVRETYWVNDGTKPGNPFPSTHRRLNFDLAGYIAKDALDMGEDSRLYVTRQGVEYVYDLSDVFREIGLQYAQWHGQWGRLTNEAAADAGQETLARSLFVAPDGDTPHYTLEYVPSADVRLQDLRGLAAHFGYGIGSTLQGYETGTQAYTLYLVDEKNNFTHYLAQSYSDEDTIESAWRTFQKLVRENIISD